jgi:AcrR family transcriptional regulator
MSEIKSGARVRGRQRPPPENFPRSEETRRRILDAARRLFATDGYERTTIRAVATRAAIDPSMVMRYYGSKDGLFAAAMDVDLRIPDLGQWPVEEIGERLATHFLDRWEGPRSGEELPLLFRAAVDSPEAAERLQQVLERQLAPAIARISSPARARRCAALIASQMIGMGYARYVLKLPFVVALPRKLIIEQMGAVVQTYIRYGVNSDRSAAG